MFADRYIERVIKTKSHLCVGLDPDLKKYPTYILKQAEEEYGRTPEGAASAILRFNKEIIDLIYDKVDPGAIGFSRGFSFEQTSYGG